MIDTQAHNGAGAELWRAWLALALCFVAAVIIFLPYVGYSTQTAAIMAELSLDYTMVGTLASAAALSGGIVVYITGGLFNRWGAKKICVAGLALSVVGQFLFAAAHSYRMMLLVRVFQGGAIPLLFLAPYTLAMLWGERSKRLGIFMGVMLASDGVGTAVATYAYSGVLSHFGWRLGSLYGAGALLVIMILLAVLLQEPAKAQPSGVVMEERGLSQFGRYLAVLKHRNVVITSLFITGLWGTLSVSVYWVPTLLIQDAKWSDDAAGFVGALYPLAGVVSAVSFGLISDRLGRRKPLMLVSGAGMVLAFILAAIAVGEHRFDILACTLPICGLFAYGGLPLGYCIAADAVGADLAGTATGCIMGTGLIIGGVFYPLLLGFIRDATGLYTLGFALAAVSVFLCNFAAVLFVRRGE